MLCVVEVIKFLFHNFPVLYNIPSSELNGFSEYF